MSAAYTCTMHIDALPRGPQLTHRGVNHLQAAAQEADREANAGPDSPMMGGVVQDSLLHEIQATVIMNSLHWSAENSALP